MRKYESRTAFRLLEEQRERIEALIKDGKYRSISQVIRIALNRFLENQ